MPEYYNAPQNITTAGIIEETPKRIGPTAIGATVTTLYTCPAKKVLRFTNFTISNYSTSAKTVKVYIVTSGGTAADSNTIVGGLSAPANGVITWSADVGFVPIFPGETIQAVASAATSLVFTGGGMEV